MSEDAPTEDAPIHDEHDLPQAHVPTASPIAPVVFGVAALAVGVLLLQQGWQIPGDLSPQGPRFLPVVLAICWILLSAIYLGGAVITLVRRAEPADTERLDHLPQVVGLVVLLVVYAYALDVVGYLISTAVFFTAAAAILGSRNHVRDAVVAVALTVAVYFLFSRSLGIYLPAGVLPI